MKKGCIFLTCIIILLLFTKVSSSEVKKDKNMIISTSGPDKYYENERMNKHFDAVLFYKEKGSANCNLRFVINQKYTDDWFHASMVFNDITYSLTDPNNKYEKGNLVCKIHSNIQRDLLNTGSVKIVVTKGFLEVVSIDWTVPSSVLEEWKEIISSQD